MESKQLAWSKQAGGGAAYHLKWSLYSLKEKHPSYIPVAEKHLALAKWDLESAGIRG